MKKLLSNIVLVILAIVIAGAIFYGTQTPSSISTSSSIPSRPSSCLYRLEMPYGLHFRGYMLNCDETNQTCFGDIAIYSSSLYPEIYDTTIKKLDGSLCSCHINMIDADCRRVFLKVGASNELLYPSSKVKELSKNFTKGELVDLKVNGCWCKLKLVDVR